MSGIFNFFNQKNTENTYVNPKKINIIKEEEQKNKPISYINEFQELWYEFINDISHFREKYPLTVLITMTVFAILGLTSFFQLSITGILSCVVYFTTIVCIAKNIGQNGTKYFQECKDSIWKIIQSIMRNPSTANV